MNRWLNWIRLEAMNASVKGHCRDYHERFDRLVLDDYHLVNLKDPAMRFLFKFAGLEGELKLFDMDAFVKGFTKMSSRHFHAPGVAGYEPRETKEIDRLLAYRDKRDGWRELDRFFKHLAGKKLSEILDAATFVYDKKDPGLGGNVCFSLGYDLAYNLDDEGMQPSNVYGSRHLALASTPQILLKLEKTTRNIGNKKLRERTGYDESVDFLQIYKNNEKVCFISIDDGEINWSKISWLQSDDEVMQAINKVAPKAQSLKMKGKYLDDALGL
jgi:hypothetical protein